MGFKVVIPARYASTRLPAKPLLDLGGRPMIQWVIDAACRSRADEVLVATDDARIAAASSDPRAPGRSLAVMTRADHLSGTDRIAEVAQARGWDGRTVVVNVQGDEPQLPPQLIDQVASLLDRHADAEIATLCTPITSVHEFLDPNVVKVVTGRGSVALYFSRAPIPWQRDSAPAGLASQASFAGARRHIGIYAYRVSALSKLASWSATPLEIAEKLEQFRALENGLQIRIADCVEPAGPDVNTPEDVERVLKHLQ